MVLLMAAKYVFDSNIFIELHRSQPEDSYPSVWKKIDELMADGTIVSSMEVFDELAIGGDELFEWAKKRKEYFIPSDVSVQKRVREILAADRGLVEGGGKTNNADPFVIALAQEMSGVVVTGEKRSKNAQTTPKIPDICIKYNIRCTNFIGFVRELQLVF